MRRIVWLCGLLAVAAPTITSAQVIQLPSFHSFSVDTTVVVPDSGPRPLAGQKRARSGSSRFGPAAPQHASGIDRQAAGAAALAKIHDPRQADAAILQRAQALRTKRPPTPAAAASTPAAASDPVPKSLAEIERLRAEQSVTAGREALALVEKARAALAAGKPAVANIYYGRAGKLAQGKLKHQVDAEVRRLNQPATVAKSTRNARAAK
jgi:hypothetical protein